jgi:hypothetical protein
MFVNAFYNNLDTFRFQIPGQPSGTNVSYYIAAQDSLAKFTGTLPMGGMGLNPPGTIAPPNVFTYDVLTGIANNEIPLKFSVEQNYPNPFNGGTYIKLNLVKTAFVKLTVSDVLGREIDVLVNSKLPAGENIVKYEAGNLASGIYYYSVFADGVLTDTRKMILSK